MAPGREQSHDGPNSDTKASNARASSHDVRIQRNSVQSGHGSGICVT